MNNIFRERVLGEIFFVSNFLKFRRVVLIWKCISVNILLKSEHIIVWWELFIVLVCYSE